MTAKVGDKVAFVSFEDDQEYGVGGIILAVEEEAVTIRQHKDGEVMRFTSSDGESWFTESLEGTAPWYLWIVEEPTKQ